MSGWDEPGGDKGGISVEGRGRVQRGGRVYAKSMKPRERAAMRVSKATNVCAYNRELERTSGVRVVCVWSVNRELWRQVLNMLSPILFNAGTVVLSRYTCQ